MTCVLVWDASPLVHAHRIDRLDVLGDIAHGPCSAPWANYTTAAVVEELGQHGGSVPDWLRVVHVDGISELRALARWVGRVSSETHSRVKRPSWRGRSVTTLTPSSMTRMRAAWRSRTA